MTGVAMTTQQFFEAIAQLSGLVFVVTSMLAMGMSLTIAQIVEPLRNVRLVALALLANFVAGSGARVRHRGRAPDR